MTYDDYVDRCNEAIEEGEGDEDDIMSRAEWNRAGADAAAEDYAGRCYDN